MNKSKVEYRKKWEFALLTSVIVILSVSLVLVFLSVFSKSKYNAALVHYSELHDGGFNEQSLDALEEMSSDYDDYSYTTVLTQVSQLDMVRSYQSLADRDTGIIIASGWLNAYAFSDPYLDKRLKENDDYVVYVDDEYGSYYNSGDGTSNILSLHFQAEEASFITGIASGIYLAARYDDPADWAATTWGGAPTSLAVLNYMSGYKTGIDFVNWYLNQIGVIDQIKIVPPKADLEQYDEFELWYTNSWDADQSATNASKYSIEENGANVLFPVAGAQTFSAMYEASLYSTQGNPDVLVVGVDTPAELTYPQFESTVLTNANKNIKAAVYDILNTYYMIEELGTSSFDSFGEYVDANSDCQIGDSSCIDFQMQTYKSGGVGYNEPTNNILVDYYEVFKGKYPNTTSYAQLSAASFGELIENIFATIEGSEGTYCIEDVDPLFLNPNTNSGAQLLAASTCDSAKLP